MGALLASALIAQPAGAATAPTTTCQAPPGTSAIDQYCEALPSPGGGSSKHHKKHSSPVSKQTTKELEQSGPAGKAVLGLADSSGSAGAQKAAPSAAGKRLAAVKRHHKRHAAASSPSSNVPSAGTNSAPALPAPDSNPLSAVGSAIGTGSSTGAVFLVLLVALAVVMGGTAVIGYRRRAREG